MQKMEGKMPEFVVTIEAESAPQIVLGQSIFGGIVTALKLEKRKLVSVAELVAKYFLNGVCRHELLKKLNAKDYAFLNGVCRHELYLHISAE